MNKFILSLLAFAMPACAQVSTYSSTIKPASVVTNGIVVEYQFADGPGATTVSDTSGHGNNGIVVGTPTFNPPLIGGVTLSPTSYIAVSSAANTAATLMAYSCTSPTTTMPQLPTYISSTISGGSAGVYGIDVYGQVINPAGFTGAGLGSFNPGVFLNSFQPLAGETINGCHLLTWIRNSGNVSDQLYIDDHQTSFYQITSSTGTLGTSLTSSGFAIGNIPLATLPASAYWPFPVYYFAAYNRALSASEIAAQYATVQAMVQKRGDIPTATPTYTDSGSEIYTVGDSITCGYNTANLCSLNSNGGWPYFLANTANLLNNPYTVVNGATSGWRLSNLLQECQTRGYSNLLPGTADTVMLMIGTNDLMTTSLPLIPVETTYQRLRRVVACYKNAPTRPRVYVTTIPSRTGTTNGVANDLIRDQYNTRIRGDAAGADGVFDLAAFPGLGADGAAANPTNACLGGPCFNTDGLHPTTAGDQYYALYAGAYINAQDAILSGNAPKLVTGSYTESAADASIYVNPATGNVTITLPSSIGLVGLSRIIANVQTTGANTVTIVPATGEYIDFSTSYVLPNGSKLRLKAVLGSTEGLANPAATSGAHWEIQ